MTNPTPEQTAFRRRTLGWGLACEEILPGVSLGRDLVLDQGDFARVEGIDNLNQDLTLALTTLLGSDVFNTQFGFDGLNALAEETNPILMRERVRIAIIQLLNKDARVRRIVDVKLADGQLQMPVPGSRELDVRVVFETIAGDQATVELGKVIPYV
jgi:hypothetical protein